MAVTYPACPTRRGPRLQDSYSTNTLRRPLTTVPVFILVGAYRRVRENEIAFGGSRQARFALNISAQCAALEMGMPSGRG